MKKLWFVLLAALCAFPAYATPLHLRPVNVVPSFACQSIASVPHCVVVDSQGFQVATTLTIPNSFSSGTVISSSAMNTNFSSIQSWSSSITDVNIGAGGIKPLHIICTGVTADCTFGGGTTAQTYIFNPNNTGIVPLSITNAGSTLSDYLDITANGGSAGGVFNIDKNGNLNLPLGAVSVPAGTGAFGGTVTVGGIIYAAPTATPTANAVWCQNDNAGTNGLTCNVPTSSTNGYRFDTAGTKRVQFTASGSVSATVDGVNNVHLTGVFNNTGADGGNTGFVQALAESNLDASVCHNANVCTSKAFSTNLSAANEGGCGVSNGTSSQQAIAFLSGTAGSYTVYWYNVSGSDITGGTTYFADVICAGY